MSFNPFHEKALNVNYGIESVSEIYPKPYNVMEVDPYTKTRVILMNGTEFEANWFSHQFMRNCDNNDLRREISLTRYVEKQQQMKIAALKPSNESILEHTLSYEQLAVDLTARLAKREPDCYVKKALDFALLEDFDHVYRYSDLLIMEEGIRGERLLGGYTEIMPARPTIAHHRYPFDNVRRHVDFKSAELITKLNTMIITAAEQQTMNYYMNVMNLYKTDIGRRLYQEIGLVEEEHVTQYESLLDPNQTWLENLLMHEYNECYLYYSCYMDECNQYIKAIWEEHLAQEISHLHKAAELLEKYEGKHWEEVIPNGEFPELLTLGPNIEYVREVIADTVQFTSVLEEYENVSELPSDANFFKFQDKFVPVTEAVPSHRVICATINKFGMDYRYQKAPNPIKQLWNRRCDNTTVGRTAIDIPNEGFKC